jgi:hypothetical protein
LIDRDRAWRAGPFNGSIRGVRPQNENPGASNGAYQEGMACAMRVFRTAMEGERPRSTGESSQGRAAVDDCDLGLNSTLE